jgi:Putative Actinobacterial Holin-X, holin superfamily III
MRASEQARQAATYHAPDRELRPPAAAAPGQHPEPSATEAVERVLDAGQRLVTERIELAKLEVEQVVTDKLSRGATIAVSGAFAFGGWWILVASLITFLDAYLVVPASLAIVGAAHVVLGGGVALVAMKRRAAASAASGPHGARS